MNSVEPCRYYLVIFRNLISNKIWYKRRTIRKLMEGGGGAKYKKIFAQEKIEWKKIMHAK